MSEPYYEILLQPAKVHQLIDLLEEKIEQSIDFYEAESCFYLKELLEEELQESMNKSNNLWKKRSKMDTMMSDFKMFLFKYYEKDKIIDLFDKYREEQWENHNQSLLEFQIYAINNGYDLVKVTTIYKEYENFKKERENKDE